MTMSFIHWTDAGEQGGVEVSHPDLLPPVAEGEWIEVSGSVATTALAVVDGKVTQVERLLPADAALSLARSTRWAEAKAYRDARAAGGCATPLGIVDTDPASLVRINGAVAMAMVAQAAGQPPAAIDWTMRDNSIVPHDGAQIMAMGVAVGRFIDACQAAGTAIRLAIAASPTPDAIDITSGYPA